jgi:hypothetical protein
MVERAFALARTGSIANLEQLARALKSEGYEQVDAHLRCSPTLNRQLRTMCRTAWAVAGNEPVAERRRTY